MKHTHTPSTRFTSRLQKYLALLCILMLVGGHQSASALTLTGAISSLQATDPALPSGVANPKGLIGYILATIFGNSGSSL